jgi:hypothetical protein
MPKRFGVLIIELSAETVKNQVFPDLVKKYFGDADGVNYLLAVLNRDGQTIFQTAELNDADAQVNLFNLAPDNFAIFANRDLMTTIGEERRKMVFSRVEGHSIQTPAPANQKSVEVQVLRSDEKPRVRIFESEHLPDGGAWTLKVQHNAGSLDAFVAGTRRRNMATSFGILSLLAISVCLIFLFRREPRNAVRRAEPQRAVFVSKSDVDKIACQTVVDRIMFDAPRFGRETVDAASRADINLP